MRHTGRQTEAGDKNTKKYREEENNECDEHTMHTSKQYLAFSIASQHAQLLRMNKLMAHLLGSDALLQQEKQFLNEKTMQNSV